MKKPRIPLEQSLGMVHSEACREAYTIFRRAKMLLETAQAGCLLCQAKMQSGGKHHARG